MAEKNKSTFLDQNWTNHKSLLAIILGILMFLIGSVKLYNTVYENTAEIARLKSSLTETRREIIALHKDIIRVVLQRK